VGLHAAVADAGAATVRAALERQLERFVALTGHGPTHVDSHRDVHIHAAALPAFLDFAQRHTLPLRGFCDARPIRSFYGQWAGETHLEQVAVPGLARILAAEVRDGFNELCCHPGYAEPQLPSSYRLERRAELDTLCDPAVAALLRDRRIRLATFRDLPTA
jgi:predicted glycoside hydrolase/deacetylase ChbG (UPF0249 family)